jgi:hypothetical protein
MGKTASDGAKDSGRVYFVTDESNIARLDWQKLVNGFSYGASQEQKELRDRVLSLHGFVSVEKRKCRTGPANLEKTNPVEVEIRRLISDLRVLLLPSPTIPQKTNDAPMSEVLSLAGAVLRDFDQTCTSGLYLLPPALEHLQTIHTVLGDLGRPSLISAVRCLEKLSNPFGARLRNRLRELRESMDAVDGTDNPGLWVQLADALRYQHPLTLTEVLPASNFPGPNLRKPPLVSDAIQSILRPSLVAAKLAKTKNCASARPEKKEPKKADRFSRGRIEASRLISSKLMELRGMNSGVPLGATIPRGELSEFDEGLVGKVYGCLLPNRVPLLKLALAETRRALFFWEHACWYSSDRFEPLREFLLHAKQEDCGELECRLFHALECIIRSSTRQQGRTPWPSGAIADIDESAAPSLIDSTELRIRW